MKRSIFLLLALTACSHAKPTPTAEIPPIPITVGGIISGEERKSQESAELREEGLRLFYSKDPRVKNPALAFKKLLEAAEQGDPPAMDAIGGIYASGSAGVKKSCAKAIEWFERAASSGYGLAANNLAYLYLTCDDKKLRNPEKAEQILKITFASNPSMIAVLDTYGALLAEGGNFDQAAATMKVVIDLQELIEANPERIDESKQALALYKKKKKLPVGFDAKPEMGGTPL